MDSYFNQLLQKTGEYGIVYQVSHPIVFVEGLPTVRPQEVVFFESGQRGEVFAINRGKIEIRIFSHEQVTVGTRVTKTENSFQLLRDRNFWDIPLTPLGEPLDPADKFVKPKLSGILMQHQRVFRKDKKFHYR